MPFAPVTSHFTDESSPRRVRGVRTLLTWRSESCPSPGAFEMTPQIHRRRPRARSSSGSAPTGSPRLTGHRLHARAGQLLGLRGRHASAACTSPTCRRARPSTSPARAAPLVDVVVDIRVGSPTFGQWDASGSTTRTGEALYLAEGLGHAFMALEDRHRDPVPLLGAATRPAASTACTRSTRRSASRWPTTGRDGRRSSRCCPTRTPRPRRWPRPSRPGLLPSYDEALAYVASLRR